MSTPTTARTAERRHAISIPGSSLGLRIENPLEWSKQIKDGLGYGKLSYFQRASLLPMDMITQLIQLPKRTLARRKKSKKLSPAESERLVRMSLVFEKACNLFDGDKASARAWLTSPCKALGFATPLGAAETELGARAVEDLIGQLEHGVFA